MFVHQLLLVGAVALLFGAGERMASLVAAQPLEVIVAAAVFAASAAVIEALALGLVGLGTNPIALFLAATGTWVAARWWVAKRRSTGGLLFDGWSRLSPSTRFAVGALCGACLVWMAWLTRYPAYDFDNLSYHIPEVVAWVHNGQPGSIVPVVPGQPYGNLPVTNEVLLAWGSGIARSFVWLTIWPGLMVALLAGAGWAGLRALRVPKLPSALATGSVCFAPMLTSFQGNGANSDLPAVVWLVAAGALCALAVRDDRAGLLIPALLATALSIGTKTTAAPLALILIALTTHRLRGHLRPLRTPLLAAVAGSFLIGGVWYVRNVIEHGSPLWPYFATPWGDPTPQLQQPNITFFSRPFTSLARFGDPGYVTDTFLGGLIVLAGAVLAAILSRRRAIVAAASATVLAVFLWTFAPDTGAPNPSFPYPTTFHGSVRFLMPAVVAATLAIALAARTSDRRLVLLWNVVLAAALVLNAVQLLELQGVRVPSARVPVIGALLGGVVVLAVQWRRLRMIPRAFAWGAACLAAAGLLTVAGHGFVSRYTRIPYVDRALFRFFAGPGDDHRTIYSAPLELVMLSQDDLSRDIESIPRREPCSGIASRARSAWVLIEKFQTDTLLGPSTYRGCVQGWHPVFEDSQALVYDTRSLTPPSS